MDKNLYSRETTSEGGMDSLMLMLYTDYLEATKEAVKTVGLDKVKEQLDIAIEIQKEKEVNLHDCAVRQLAIKLLRRQGFTFINYRNLQLSAWYNSQHYEINSVAQPEGEPVWSLQELKHLCQTAHLESLVNDALKNGLHKRYNISKTNGKPIDPKAEYFVLRLDSNGDPKHVQACRRAIMTYAKHIQEHLPMLSKDLIERYAIKDD